MTKSTYDEDMTTLAASKKLRGLVGDEARSHGITVVKYTDMALRFALANMRTEVRVEGRDDGR